jgi:hypothetical protein
MDASIQVILVARRAPPVSNTDVTGQLRAVCTGELLPTAYNSHSGMRELTGCVPRCPACTCPYRTLQVVRAPAVTTVLSPVGYRTGKRASAAVSSRHGKGRSQMWSERPNLAGFALARSDRFQLFLDVFATDGVGMCWTLATECLQRCGSANRRHEDRPFFNEEEKASREKASPQGPLRTERIGGCRPYAKMLLALILSREVKGSRHRSNCVH